MAWEVFKAAIPLLHLFDRLRPGDTCLNLSVLWWKAIAGNRCAIRVPNAVLVVCVCVVYGVSQSLHLGARWRLRVHTPAA